MTELLRLDPETEAKFWARVSQPSLQPFLPQCWLWTGGSTPEGYGRFHLADGKMVGPHRLAYEMIIGPIPTERHGKRVCLDHICKNPPCVNPFHLRPFTWSENALREQATTHCPKGHEYAVVGRVNGEWRGQGSCAECNRIRARAYHEKKRKLADT